MENCVANSAVYQQFIMNVMVLRKIGLVTETTIAIKSAIFLSINEIFIIKYL